MKRIKSGAVIVGLLAMLLAGCQPAAETDGAVSTTSTSTTTESATTTTEDSTSAVTTTSSSANTTTKAKTTAKPTTTKATTTKSTTASTSTTTTAATTTARPDDGVLTILMIGNSFAVDASHYAWNIAREVGYDSVKLGVLYQAGCSINQHATKANNKTGYTYFRNTDGRWVTEEDVSLDEALRFEDWDYITMQQASADSGRPTSYAFLSMLVRYVAQRLPHAELVWHMTWAYAQDTVQGAFSTYNNDQMTMYDRIVSCTQEQVLKNEELMKPFAKMIPNGTAIQNARTSYLGDTFNIPNDGAHLKDPIGRYVAALTMVHAITGKAIDRVTYAPNGVSEREKAVAIAAAKAAVAKPYEPTTISA